MRPFDLRLLAGLLAVPVIAGPVLADDAKTPPASPAPPPAGTAPTPTAGPAAPPGAAKSSEVDWTGEPDSSKAGSEAARWQQWKDGYAALWKKVSEADPVALAQNEQGERDKLEGSLSRSRESILRRIMRIKVNPFTQEKEKQLSALFDAKIAEGKKRIAEAAPVPPTPPPTPPTSEKPISSAQESALARMEDEVRAARAALESSAAETLREGQGGRLALEDHLTKAENEFKSKRTPPDHPRVTAAMEAIAKVRADLDKKLAGLPPAAPRGPAPQPPATPPAASGPAPAGVLSANDKKSLDEFEALYKGYYDEVQACPTPPDNVDPTWIASTKRKWNSYQTKMLLPLRRIKDKSHPDVVAAQKKLDAWPAVVDQKTLGWQKAAPPPPPPAPAPDPSGLSATDKNSLSQFEDLYKQNYDTLQTYEPPPGDAVPSWIDSAKRMWNGKQSKMLLYLGGIRKKEHPDVVAAQKKIDDWPAVVDRKALDWQKAADAAAGVAAAGEAQKAERTKLIGEAKKPFEHFDPSYAGQDPNWGHTITPEKERAWLDGLKTAKAAHAAGLAKLEKAATLPKGKDPYLVVDGMPVYELAEYIAWYKKIPASMDAAVEEHEKRILAWFPVEDVEPTEKWKDDELTFDAGVQRGVDKLEGLIRMIGIVTVTEKEWYGRDGKPQEAEIARLKAWIDGLKTARTAAISRVRLPADLGDAELRKFAAEGVAHVQRTVRRFAVTSKIEKKDTGEWYKGVWVPLVWEEFRVKTIEKDDQGAWRVNYVVIRKNHKGWDEWKFGMWTVHIRDCGPGPIILEENIDK